MADGGRPARRRDRRRWARAGCRASSYFAELAARLRRVIDCDATCWHTLDPQTRLMTSDAPQELIERGVFTAESAAAAGELHRRQRVPASRTSTRSPASPRGASRSASSSRRRVAGPSAARATASCSPRPASRTSCAPRSSCRGRVLGRGAHRAPRGRGRLQPPPTPPRSRASPARSREGIRASLRFDAARRRGTSRGAGDGRARRRRTRSSSSPPPARELLAELRGPRPASTATRRPRRAARARRVRPRPDRRRRRAAATS